MKQQNNIAPYVSWKRWIGNVLPHFLRKPIIISLLYSAIRPIEWIYNEFLKLWKKIHKKTIYTSQVCSLRGLLNDEFDPILRRFRVFDGKARGKMLIAVSNDNNPAPEIAVREKDKNVPIAVSQHRDDEGQNTFYISIPSDIYDDNISKIKDLVDEYKLPSKQVKYIKQ